MDLTFRAGIAALGLGILFAACASTQEAKSTQAAPSPVIFVPHAQKQAAVSPMRSTTPPPARSAARKDTRTGAVAAVRADRVPPAASGMTAPATPHGTGAPLAVASAAIPSVGGADSQAVVTHDSKLPAVVVQPPNAPPQILAVELSSSVASAGQVVSGIVQTSSNVASVEARVGGQSASMLKVNEGRFTLSYRVPNLPFWMHKSYLIQVIARNTAGVAVSTAVPITIR